MDRDEKYCVIKQVYMCRKCKHYYESEEDAYVCCSPKIVEVYCCTICKKRSYKKNTARDCCHKEKLLLMPEKPGKKILERMHKFPEAFKNPINPDMLPAEINYETIRRLRLIGDGFAAERLIQAYQNNKKENTEQLRREIRKRENKVRNFIYRVEHDDRK